MKIPEQAREYMDDALESGAKIFYFDNGEEDALFVDHLNRDVTIVSWPKAGDDVSFCNISISVRDGLSEDLRLDKE